MNLEQYFQRLVSACIEREMVLLPLGKTGRQVIWMVKSRGDISGKSLLISGGFHGDEISGPLGILKFLEEADNKLFKNKLAFIPIVSPIAFSGKRRNSYSPSNCGFVPGIKDKLSVEGKVLKKNMKLLVRCSEAGFLSLHETMDETHFYLYAYGGDEQGYFYEAEQMRDQGLKYFKQLPNGTKMYETNCPQGISEEGIVWKMFDGSLEHRLWLDGAPICIVSETPGKKPLATRVRANVALIKKFIGLRGGKNEG